MNEPIETPVEEKPAESKTSIIIALLAGLAIGGAGVGTGEYFIDQNDLTAKLELAKVETLADVQVPEKPDLAYDTAIVGKDTTITMDTVKMIPARVDPRFAKYSSGYITGANDTIVATYTIQNKDSIVYCGTFTPGTGQELIIKTQFVK